MKSIFRCWMWSGYEIRLCNNPFKSNHVWIYCCESAKNAAQILMRASRSMLQCGKAPLEVLAKLWMISCDEPHWNQYMRDFKWIESLNAAQIVMRDSDSWYDMMSFLQMNTCASFNTTSLEMLPKLWYEHPIYVPMSWASFKWYDQRV